MSILTDAEHLVGGEKNAAYGHPLQDFQRVAVIWSGILNMLVTPEQVGLCLAGLKLAREAFQHNRDSLVDLAGYALTLQMIADAKEPPCPTKTTVLPVEQPSTSCAGTPNVSLATPSLSPAAKGPTESDTTICPTCQRFLHPTPHRCND